MIRKSVFTNGNEYLKSSVQEINQVYEQNQNDVNVTKSELSGKYIERDVQSVIDSIEKSKNPDPRIKKLRSHLKYLLWTVFVLTILQIPFLFPTSELSTMQFGLEALLGLFPSLIALVLWYINKPWSYIVIFSINAFILVIHLTGEIIHSLFTFSFEPLFLASFLYYLLLILLAICVIVYCYKLMKMDDYQTFVIAKIINHE